MTIEWKLGYLLVPEYVLDSKLVLVYSFLFLIKEAGGYGSLNVQDININLRCCSSSRVKS